MDTGSRRVLVPLDGSASDAAIAPLAAAMAGRLAAELVLLRIVRPVLPPLFQRYRPCPEQAAADAELIARTEAAVAEADRELRNLEADLEGTPVSRIILISSTPAARTLEWLRTHPVALVVAAAAPMGGVHRMIGAELWKTIVRSGLAPVVTVLCHRGGEAEAPSRMHTRHQRRVRCVPVRMRSKTC